jgi:hypothetical protein
MNDILLLIGILVICYIAYIGFVKGGNPNE